MSSFPNGHGNQRHPDVATSIGRQDGATGGKRNSPHGTADECFETMVRHHARLRQAGGANATPAVPPPADGARTRDRADPAEPGDIIYGARAIALFIFGDDGDRARRRVFNLWAHYRDRKEAAGFLKLNGAVCLSKSKWQAFHGLR
ncbi:hypothetical protein [Rhodoplanes sp. SY1]|uniref:hypothetical protein n=1 Tax=Rhodoplanes sp. SY1 TaxID=3166646 RepID=UPI0038B5EEC5